ncbi:hypothetical protein CAEBREN_22820 [Caenorhabditis brenneri]|uniref:RRM domain-containing protein n=1 Tax=Caenorhabditis brenneri TaxID=135651 RepID=G0NIG8_CAEBE|nr:hypothetical protein CAEBREN_22820 [Caenorhabditis brenneri]
MDVPPDGPHQLRKLFIGGLPHEINESQLGCYFSQWGNVIDACVLRDPSTQQSRGFGFVTYSSVFHVDIAMAHRPHYIFGKQVDTKRAISREQMSSAEGSKQFNAEPLPGYKLLLSGIVMRVHCIDFLLRYFNTYGSVEQVEILCSPPPSVGFVVFKDEESAINVLTHNSGHHSINGMTITASVFPSEQEMLRESPESPDSGHVEDVCHESTSEPGIETNTENDL